MQLQSQLPCGMHVSNCNRASVHLEAKRLSCLSPHMQVMYDKPDAPSNFTLKLRKHLRTRRLEDVRQLGVDRVVDLVFGTGENAHHLILEMYAQVGLCVCVFS